MNCETPLDPAVLTDYWLAALPGSEEKAVDLHILECDACGARLREIIALAGAICDVARSGSLRMIVSDTFLQRAAQDGLRVREYAPPNGGSVQCTVTAEDDLLIGRLAADLSAATRVDLCLCDAKGVEQLRMSDIPVRDGAGDIAFQESISYAKAAPAHTMIARLVAFDAAGAERLLGEYTFNHARSMPGPADW